MKVILLDIDGVLVITPPWRPPDVMEDGFSAFSSLAIAEINRLIKATRGKVVLVTSHRHRFSLEKWIGIFKRRGILLTTIGRIDAQQNEHENVSRANEIADWLKRQSQLRNYVILDDDGSIGSLPVEIRSRWVKIKPLIGLDTVAVDEAIEILNADLNRN